MRRIESWVVEFVVAAEVLHEGVACVVSTKTAVATEFPSSRRQYHESHSKYG